jgi:hypothetical protein
LTSVPPSKATTIPAAISATAAIAVLTAAGAARRSRPSARTAVSSPPAGAGSTAMAMAPIISVQGSRDKTSFACVDVNVPRAPRYARVPPTITPVAEGRENVTKLST